MPKFMVRTGLVEATKFTTFSDIPDAVITQTTIHYFDGKREVSIKNFSFSDINDICSYLHTTAESGLQMGSNDKTFFEFKGKTCENMDRFQHIAYQRGCPDGNVVASFDEILEWVLTVMDAIPYAMVMVPHGLIWPLPGLTKIERGQWVVRGDGLFQILSDKEFNDRYVRVP